MKSPRHKFIKESIDPLSEILFFQERSIVMEAASSFSFNPPTYFGKSEGTTLSFSPSSRWNTIIKHSKYSIALASFSIALRDQVERVSYSSAQCALKEYKIEHISVNDSRCLSDRSVIAHQAYAHTLNALSSYMHPLHSHRRQKPGGNFSTHLGILGAINHPSCTCTSCWEVWFQNILLKTPLKVFINGDIIAASIVAGLSPSISDFQKYSESISKKVPKKDSKRKTITSSERQSILAGYSSCVWRMNNRNALSERNSLRKFIKKPYFQQIHQDSTSKQPSMPSSPSIHDKTPCDVPSVFPDILKPLESPSMLIIGKGVHSLCFQRVNPDTDPHSKETTISTVLPPSSCNKEDLPPPLPFLSDMSVRSSLLSLISILTLGQSNSSPSFKSGIYTQPSQLRSYFSALRLLQHWTWVYYLKERSLSPDDTISRRSSVLTPEYMKRYNCLYYSIPTAKTMDILVQTAPKNTTGSKPTKPDPSPKLSAPSSWTITPDKRGRMCVQREGASSKSVPSVYRPFLPGTPLARCTPPTYTALQRLLVCISSMCVRVSLKYDEGALGNMYYVENICSTLNKIFTRFSVVQNSKGSRSMEHSAMAGVLSRKSELRAQRLTSKQSSHSHLGKRRTSSNGSLSSLPETKKRSSSGRLVDSKAECIDEKQESGLGGSDLCSSTSSKGKEASRPFRTPHTHSGTSLLQSTNPPLSSLSSLSSSFTSHSFFSGSGGCQRDGRRRRPSFHERKKREKEDKLRTALVHKSLQAQGVQPGSGTVSSCGSALCSAGFVSSGLSSTLGSGISSISPASSLISPGSASLHSDISHPSTIFPSVQPHRTILGQADCIPPLFVPGATSQLTFSHPFHHTEISSSEVILLCDLGWVCCTENPWDRLVCMLSAIGVWEGMTDSSSKEHQEEFPIVTYSSDLVSLSFLCLFISSFLPEFDLHSPFQQASCALTIAWLIWVCRMARAESDFHESRREGKQRASQYASACELDDCKISQLVTEFSFESISSISAREPSLFRCLRRYSFSTISSLPLLSLRTLGLFSSIQRNIQVSGMCAYPVLESFGWSAMRCVLWYGVDDLLRMKRLKKMMKDSKTSLPSFSHEKISFRSFPVSKSKNMHGTLSRKDELKRNKEEMVMDFAENSFPPTAFDDGLHYEEHPTFSFVVETGDGSKTKKSVKWI
ncbi:hypothetical protein ADUPG1_013473 [Aduncisulcus paluster]|uniref:Uncharacterized protein n=1 Tax=Aduncisulcus paluster TaxID=2918883 RepID=A0ABQ5K7T4_9EUKA|nr:hypothetical protein ADUPG1_013473 [Aduncisulcus paluster]